MFRWKHTLSLSVICASLLGCNPSKENKEKGEDVQDEGQIVAPITEGGKVPSNGGCQSTDQTQCSGDNTPKPEETKDFIIYPSLPLRERQAVTVQAYKEWKSKYLTNEGCGDKWYVKSGGGTGEDVGDTISEGNGYGMVILPLMDKVDGEAHKIFDGMVRFYLKNRNSKTLLPHWTVHPDKGCIPLSESNKGSATDGDLDAAYGLLLAEKVWGNNGKHNYGELARQLIRSILTYDINRNTLMTKLGDGFPTFDTHTRPSDFMIGHFKAFAQATQNTTWEKVAENSLEALRQLQDFPKNKTRGLVPDFAQLNASNTYEPVKPGYLEGAHDGDYYANSCRVPWRLMADLVHSRDENTKVILNRMNTWFKEQSKGDVNKLSSGYALKTGKGLGDYQDMFYLAPIAVGAMSLGEQEWLDQLYDAVKANQEDKDYYGESIRLLTLLIMSEDWPKLY